MSSELKTKCSAGAYDFIILNFEIHVGKLLKTKCSGRGGGGGGGNCWI